MATITSCSLYTNAYLTSSNYTSRYMFNRLRQSAVTDGTNTTTLSYVYYDGEPGSCGGSSMIDPSLPPGLLRIPAKANADSEGNANGIPGRRRTVSERSDAGISIVQEVFVFVKKNLSGA